MEDEIKVGEYIRTKDGVIDKIVDIRDTYSERKLIAFEKSNSLKSDIGLKAMVVKHSSNLIDLIKAEDTIKIKIGLYTSFVHFIVDEDDLISIKAQIEANFWIIDKIYTKEMMESISYKVERKD